MKAHQPLTTVSSVYIPSDKFVCAPKPEQPVKTKNPETGVMGYLDSAIAFWANDMEKARADCESHLHEVRDIYNQQSKDDSKGVDASK